MTDSNRHEVANDGAAGAWMESHQADLARQCQTWRSGEIRWSWARLVTFVAAVLGLYLFREDPRLALGAAGVFVVLFGWSVRRHLRTRARREFGERLVAMAAESLRRCGGRLTVIRDGQHPADADDSACLVPAILEPGPVAALTEQERDDLDLYAEPVGIFGLLNRCSTALGARRLRDVLERPCLSIERITARHTCVAWLADRTAARLRLMAAVAGLRGHDDRLDAFVRTVRTAKALESSWLARFLQLWSVPSVAFTVYASTQAGVGQYRWGFALLALVAFNGILFMQVRRALREVIEPWRDLRPTAGALLFAAKQAADDLPDDNELIRLRDRLAAVAAPDVLGALCSRLAWTETGGLIHVLCNLVFFYDLHVARAVLNRVVPNRDALIAAAGALADVEALSSLACFAWEQPVTCTPTPAVDPVITIVGGAHPLIEPDELVLNDVHLAPDERTWIVTGSNMAGKSTFLRMVGVNVLLAQIGTTATARQMTFHPHRLITDLRIRDDLAKHESYFLAEVRQVRRMLAPDGGPARQTTRLLGLIDELFRGTNSQERVAAALAVVGHLIDSPHFFLVATHEQQLTDLAERGGAKNHHFREDLTDAGPVFDYRLRLGPATTRNALRILEREGYPPIVVQRAQAFLEQSDTSAEGA